MFDNKGKRRLELAFFATGLAAAALFVGLSTPAVLARMKPVATQATDTSSQPAADSPVIPAAALGSSYGVGAAGAAHGTRIGTITIPALHLSAPVIEGVDDADLRSGVGHVPGSALSGGLGNVVLAAHRDTLFRPIRGIQKGMDVQVTGGEGTFHYQVDSLQVVAPDRLDVLEIASQPEVTLITCYPFNFVGSAPMRFIVKAHLVSTVPEDDASRSR